MQPWQTLDTETSPDGTRVDLCRRGGEFAIRANGKTLMSNRASRSEIEMATLVAKALGSGGTPRVLLGGLGMGFTLRSLLDALPAGSVIRCVELLPKVIEWNRGVLGACANHPLGDARVTLETTDVFEVIKRERAAWQAILLDVDNGPSPFCYGPNRRLYEGAGLAAIRTALTEGGVFSVWSVDPDPRFQQRLAKAGFIVNVHRSSAYGAPGSAHRGKRHTLYIARAAGDRRRSVRAA